MTAPSSVLHYRAPPGRPRAIPPCDLSTPAVATGTEPTKAAEADSRPVREPGESRARYAARVGHWMDRQDPARKAARIAKRKATTRKRFLRRKRKEAAEMLAAQMAAEAAPERWYTPRELREVTGWSPKYIRKLAADWPRRPSQRQDKNSSRAIEMFGNPATLQGLRPQPALRVAVSEPASAAIDTPAPAPRPPSLWQRIKRWFA